MAEQPGLSDQYTRASPWPVVVVLGLVLSEIGVLFAYEPIAVGGLVLFGGSVVGILRESQYADSLWAPALVVGVLFGALGGLMVAGHVYADVQSGFRGLMVLAGSGLVVAASAVLFLYERHVI